MNVPRYFVLASILFNVAMAVDGKALRTMLDVGQHSYLSAAGFDLLVGHVGDMAMGVGLLLMPWLIAWHWAGTEARMGGAVVFALISALSCALLPLAFPGSAPDVPGALAFQMALSWVELFAASFIKEKPEAA